MQALFTKNVNPWIYIENEICVPILKNRFLFVNNWNQVFHIFAAAQYFVIFVKLIQIFGIMHLSRSVIRPNPDRDNLQTR